MPVDNCPHCNSGHVWVDPIGPAPKPWRWVCGTHYEERTDLCKALGLAECRKRLLAEKDARIASLAAEVERLKNGCEKFILEMIELARQTPRTSLEEQAYIHAADWMADFIRPGSRG